MPNTYSSVKTQLIELLKNQDHEVIVLKGKWGTGKSRLWQDTKAELYQDNKQSIYVSLFGVKTINELKLRIFQSYYLQDTSWLKRQIKKISDFINNFLRRPNGSSVADGFLLWLPELVTGKLIVIDDIERKHKTLEIDELLGLLDEYSENHNVRFLILLNTDKLTESDAWASLHEKVVDVEVTLEPLPSESFEIAVEGKNEAYMPETKRAVEILNISNIRVIRKIINTISYIIKASEINDVPVSNWIASTVLLTASHYRAITNPPSFEYIKSFNYLSYLIPSKKEQPSADELNWGELLNKLGIRGSDSYEDILHEFLQSGMLDIDGLKTQFEKYKRDENSSVVGNQLSEFFKNTYWNPHKSEAELLNMARELLPLVGKLSYETITSIVSAIEEQIGDPGLAREFLDNCLQSMDAQPLFRQLEPIQHGNECHPEIIAKIDLLRERLNPPLSLIETVESIIKNSGLGEQERAALRNSSIQQYEDTLRQIKNESLRRFMNQHIEWINNPYNDDTKNGVDNFVSACIKIYSTNPTTRLSRIIHRCINSKISLEEGRQ